MAQAENLINSRLSPLTDWSQYRDLLIEAATIVGATGASQIIYSKMSADVYSNPTALASLIEQAFDLTDVQRNELYSSRSSPVFARIAIGVAASSSGLDAQRPATLAKLIELATAEQSASRQDAAQLGLTPGSATTSSTLPNLYTYQNNSEVFEAFGGVPKVTNDPRTFVIAQMDDAPNTGGGMAAFMPGSKAYYQNAVEWRTRIIGSRYVEIATRDTTGAPLRLWVNGQLAVAGRAGFSNAAGGDISYTKFDLGAVGDYDITLEVHGAQRFYGMAVDGTCVKQTRARTGTMLVLGDSYTSGASYTALRSNGLMKVLGRYLGMHNVVPAGLSGSSMVTSTGTKKWDVNLGAGSSIYLDFVDTELAPVIDPDIVVVALGYNDNGSQTPTVTALRALWERVRTDFPRALIVCMGMWGGTIQSLITLQNREEAARTSFTAWADPFSIFVRSQFAAGSAGNNRIMFGTGDITVPTHDGINDYILNTDNNHLQDGVANRDGQWYVATKIRDAIIKGLNAMPPEINPESLAATYWPLDLKTTPASVPAATVGSPYLFSVMSTGGGPAGSKTHSIQTGSIPPGLTLQAQQGHLTGTPTTAGTYNFTIRCTDSVTGGTVDLASSITVT